MSGIPGVYRADPPCRRPELIPVGADGESKQPLGTVFEQSLLLYCDALVLLAMRRLGITDADMAKQHTQLE